MITTEYTSKKQEFLDDKIYDLELQYSAKLISNIELANAILSGVTEDDELLSLVNEANNDINKNFNRDFLLKKYKNKYIRMKEQGILQFHIHLADGESYLRLHKPSKYGDNLLSFRKSVQEVIRLEKPVYGFEVGNTLPKGTK